VSELCIDEVARALRELLEDTGADSVAASYELQHGPMRIVAKRDGSAWVEHENGSAMRLGVPE